MPCAPAPRGLTAAGLALAALTATASPSQALVGGQYTGFLSVSATTVKVGTAFTATQQAISLGDTQTPGITVGIRRLGFTVVASQPPRTGICRIAGSATCSFLLLAPHETQAYTLTLAPTTAGTFQLTGWTTQPIAGGSGGTVQTVTITVTPDLAWCARLNRRPVARPAPPRDGRSRADLHTVCRDAARWPVSVVPRVSDPGVSAA